MSLRTIATLRRPEPHEPEPDPGDPLICARCRLLIRNQLHDPDLVAAHIAKVTERTAAEMRRLGEHD